MRDTGCPRGEGRSLVRMPRATLRSIRRSLRRVRHGRYPVILMYHRISEGGEDPWEITVSPSNLVEHLEVLDRRRRVITLRQLADGVAAGELLRDAAVITFDDGYVDNLHVVSPLLERYGIPATMFIIAGAVGRRTEFWWDELGRILLQPGRLPATLHINAGGAVHEWALGSECDYPAATAAAHRGWRGREAPPTKRHALYLALCELIWPLSMSEQEWLLGQLREWAGVSLGMRPERRFLTIDELAALAAGGLIEIGAHSVTHASLPELSPGLRQNEIRRSKILLEDYIGCPVNAFAYPYGKYDKATVAAVRGASFVYACTAEGNTVRRDADLYRLPRFEMRDWDGDEFERRLSKQFT